jgi:hypothetical protein
MTWKYNYDDFAHNSTSNNNLAFGSIAKKLSLKLEMIDSVKKSQK